MTYSRFAVTHGRRAAVLQHRVEWIMDAVIYDENNNIYTETPDSVLHNNIIPATG